MEFEFSNRWINKLLTAKDLIPAFCLLSLSLTLGLKNARTAWLGWQAISS